MQYTFDTDSRKPYSFVISTLAAELNRLEGIEYAILQFEKQRVAFIENK